MPEGHTLHALGERIAHTFGGRAVRASSPQGRFADGAALLDGQVLTGAGAYGKQLFVEFAVDRVLHVHLGLIGRFTVLPLEPGVPEPAAVGTVRLRLLSTTHVADLRGAIVCAVITPEEVATVVAGLGPDPLRPDADPDLAWQRMHRSARAPGELLMDQSVLAGVGNVCRCEVLFRHRVDPFRPGREIRHTTWELIWADLVRPLPAPSLTRASTQTADREGLAKSRAAGRVATSPGRALRHAGRGEPQGAIVSAVGEHEPGGLKVRNSLGAGGVVPIVYRPS